MSTEPVSRRARPAKSPLSRQAVVDVAMGVMRADGLTKVTMRRIATELDTGPASLYVYVGGVAELHGAMIDELLADLSLPARVTRSSWRRATVDVLVRFSDLLRAEPALAMSAVSLRPSGPRYLDLVDWLLQSMRRGEVPVQNAAWGVDLLLQVATASAAEQGRRHQSAGTPGDEVAQVAAIEHADRRRQPGLAWARDHLFTGGPDRLAWHFDHVLAGLAAPG